VLFQVNAWPARRLRRFALAVAALALGCAVSPPADRGAPAAVPATPAAAKELPACGSPTDRQVEAWLSAMTLDEKIALVAGTGSIRSAFPACTFRPCA